jgi:magnesium and cobalt transporter
MNSEDRSSSGSFTERLLEKLFSNAGNEPETKEQLVELLRQAKNRALFDTDALSMMEGVLQVSDLQVRDIMIPRAQMVVVGRDDDFNAILPVVVESAHSRFPVIGEDRAEVVGTLLAKDLLQYFGDKSEKFKLREIIRSAVFVPESKRLDVLLKEFRASRNHMAIVVDEYGLAAGLVTIEDVLEQIVGEIEDEHDFDEGAFIMRRDDKTFTAKAHTTLEDFNEYFNTTFEDDDYDTIGGLVLDALGHMPKRGETVEVGGFCFEVLRADSRKIQLLNIVRL